MDEDDPLIGSRIAGRYVVERRLGQGGMGAIYVARQLPIDRPVVLKVLLESLARDEVAVARFEKEALAVSRLLHPHIVTLFDFGQTDRGELFIAMELIPGRSLREVLASEGALPWRRTLPILIGIAKGLTEAHRQGIIHRDLKPENVMIVATGDDGEFPKLLDFGLARTLDASGSGGEKLTAQNMIPGTPTYLAPERAHGSTDDHRGDIYSLGAMWFELLTGKPPFEDQNPIKVIVMHIQEPVPDPRAVAPHQEIPDAVIALLRRLLEKRPEHRPQSAQEVVRALQELENPEHWSATSPGQLHLSRATPDVFQEVTLSELRDLEFGAPSLLDEAPVPLTKQKPIALTQRKGDAARGVSLPPQDTTEVPAHRPEPRAGPALETTGPLASVADAATWLARARTLDDAMDVLGRYLKTQFSRALIVDVRAPPYRVVSAQGTHEITNVHRLVLATPGFMDLAGRPQPYIGPRLDDRAWHGFHHALSSGLPAKVLLTSLRRGGQPAFVIYAEHDDAAARFDVAALALVVKEAAAALASLAP